MKIGMSDRDGTYYGKYNELRQCPSPFVKLIHFTKWIRVMEEKLKSMDQNQV